MKILVPILILFTVGSVILNWAGVDPKAVLFPTVDVARVVLERPPLDVAVSVLRLIVDLAILVVTFLVRFITLLVAAIMIGFLLIGLLGFAGYRWKRRNDILRNSLSTELTMVSKLHFMPEKQHQYTKGTLTPADLMPVYFKNLDDLDRLTDEEREAVIQSYSRLCFDMTRSQPGTDRSMEGVDHFDPIEANEAIDALEEHSKSSVAEELIERVNNFNPSAGKE